MPDERRQDLDLERLETLRVHMNEYADQGKIAGINAAIVQVEGPSFFHSYGFSDLDTRRAMTADAIFRIYSLTKPMIATGILQLLERGKILLTDPVAQHLPELKSLKVYMANDAAPQATDQELTIHHLLTHTGGFGYGQDEDHPVDHQYNAVNLFDKTGTIGEMVLKLSDIPLKFQPGSRFEYSISYDVLGRLIEVVSGLHLDQYMSEMIFEPLQMFDTGFEVSQNKVGRLTTLYRNSASGGLEAEHASETERFITPVTFFAGGEGLVSTVPDCLKFMRMLIGNGTLDGVRCLSPSAVALMTQNHLTDDHLAGLWLDGQGYGLGVSVIRDLAGAKNLGSVGEFGWAGSASTFFWASPADDLIGILFAQHMPSSDYTIAREFKALMYQALG